MKAKRIFIAAILSFACLLGGCSYFESLKEIIKPQPNPNPANCGPEVVCTANYVIITASVRYSDNTPVILDGYRVIQTSTGADRTPKMNPSQLEMYRKSGIYPIATDDYQKEWVNQRVELEFIGYQNNKEVVRRKFIVGADCCHVMLLAGDRNIIIEKQ